MTRHFKTLKVYKPLGAAKGDILVQNDQSATELGMDSLVEQGFFQELTQDEAVSESKSQHPEDWAL